VKDGTGCVGMTGQGEAAPRSCRRSDTDIGSRRGNGQPAPGRVSTTYYRPSAASAALMCITPRAIVGFVGIELGSA